MKAKSIRVPGQGRVYCRGKIWYVDYWADGQRIREKAGANMRDAVAFLGERTSVAGRGSRAPLKKKVVPFAEFADRFLELKAGGLRPARSIRSMRGFVGHLKDIFGDVPLSMITPEMVEDYRLKRSEDHVMVARRGCEERTPLDRNVSGTTINRELSVLRNIFNTAKRLNLYHGNNPVTGASFCKEEARRHKILTQDEFKKLVEAADPRLRPIIMVAVQTGLRKNDVLALKRKDLDVERLTLTAWVSKTQTWQIFTLGRDLVETLKAQPGSSEFIFENPETKTRLFDCRKWWESAKAKAGLSDPGLLRFHDLRANAGTRLCDKAGTYAAQLLLGHKSAKTTALYLNVPPEHAQAAAAILADFFRTDLPVGGAKVAQAPRRVSSTPSDSTH